MFVKPEQNVASLLLQEGMVVADLGAGTGHYTRALSSRVGVSGRVYAVEIQKGMVKKLEHELKEEGIKNVQVIWGDIEEKGGTNLDDASMDAVIISNVLFQVSDKLGLVHEAKRILKHDGKLLLVDWKDSYEGMGPAPQYVVRKEIALDIFEKAGFKAVESISDPYHHYGIIFTYV